jgi:hypothetical protein
MASACLKPHVFVIYRKPLLAGIILLVTFLWSNVVQAHRPLWDEGAGTEFSNPIKIDHVDVSQVVYREVTRQTPRLWLTFEAQEGEELYLQLGVPVLERLKSFRPVVALLGPAMTPLNLSFEIPAGLGGRIFEAENGQEPRIFHEPFTGTDSWVLIETRLKATAAGRYFIVAYSPSGETGKLWIAVGEREQFGFADLFRFPGWRSKTRAFHEVK